MFACLGAPSGTVTGTGLLPGMDGCPRRPEVCCTCRDAVAVFSMGAPSSPLYPGGSFPCLNSATGSPRVITLPPVHAVPWARELGGSPSGAVPAVSAVCGRSLSNSLCSGPNSPCSLGAGSSCISNGPTPVNPAWRHGQEFSELLPLIVQIERFIIVQTDCLTALALPQLWWAIQLYSKCSADMSSVTVCKK